MVTQKYLIDNFIYDKHTGIFTRRVDSKNGRWKAGSIAGYTQKAGYTVINIDGGPKLAHRLAWLYEYGKYPENFIDHKNHNRSDNWIDNLRDVTNKINCGDRKISAAKFCWDKSRGKWKVQSWEDGKNIFLGRYDTKEEAIDVVNAYKKEMT